MAKGKNDGRNISDSGKTVVRQREGFKLKPYDDVAKNCTSGVGTLMHLGPCKEAELKMKFTSDAVVRSLDQHLAENARYVKHYVKEQELNQNQFDALVSFVYNVGVGNALPVLSLANQGELSKVPDEMKKYHNVKVKDKNGHVTYQSCPGLINRRNSEATQFSSEQ